MGPRGQVTGMGCTALIAVLLLPSFPRAATAQATVPGDSVPASAPTSIGHLAVQTLVGAVAGWGAAIGLGYLGSKTIGEQGGEDPGLEGAVIGFPIGFLGGTTLGVGLTARSQGEPHSFLAAFLGALAGGGLAVVGATAIQHSPTAYVLAFVLPAGTAVASSHFFGTRARLRAGPTRNGQLALGFSLSF